MQQPQERGEQISVPVDPNLPAQIEQTADHANLMTNEEVEDMTPDQPNPSILLDHSAAQNSKPCTILMRARRGTSPLNAVSSGTGL